MKENNNISDCPCVALDTFVLAQNIKTGIYRVCDELFPRMAKHDDLNINYIAREDLKKQSEKYLNDKIGDHVLNTYDTINKSNTPDLLLSPFGPAPEKLRSNKKLLHAHIIYDLIAIRRPDFFTPEAANEVCSIISSLDANTLVFAISEHTKNDLLEYRPDIDPDNVIVLPLAASNNFNRCMDLAQKNSVRTKYNIPLNSPYLLSLATLEVRKNLEQVVRVFTTYMEHHSNSNLHLVLSGMTGWKLDKLNCELLKAGKWRERIILTGFIDDSDLPALYSDALCFIYLSRYEGFGLPPLEAMACGTPVICADNSSLPEVVGKAAILVNASDTGKTVTAIHEIASSSELRKRLSSMSLERAKKFSWDKSANLLSDAIIRYYKQHKKHSAKTSNSFHKRLSNIGNKHYPTWIDFIEINDTKFIHGGKRLSNIFKSDKKKRPLISYITIVKNNAGSISRTIESVLQQSYSNIEYIILDGASTDGTLEIIEKYSEQLDYYASTPDTGLYNALNKAIQLARGSLICVLNSDDWLTEDAAQIAATCFEGTNEAAILCSAATVIDNDIKLDWLPSPVNAGSYLTCANICHNAVYATKRAYEVTGLYNETYQIASDTEWIMKVFNAGTKFIYTDKSTVNYSLGGVSGNFLAHSMECMRIAHERFPFLTRKEINGLYHSFFTFSNLHYRYDIDRPVNRNAFIKELNIKYNDPDFLTALTCATESAIGTIPHNLLHSRLFSVFKRKAIPLLKRSPRVYALARNLYRTIINRN